MKTIAYIEDDPDMIDLVSIILQKHGYQVAGFTESREIIPRLELSPKERVKTAEKFFGYLDDQSKIVQTNTLQALVDLAWEDDDLFDKVKIEVERFAEQGSPAVKNRAGKLLSDFSQDES